MYRRFAAAVLVVVATSVAATARAQSAANGEALHRAYCATCHATPVASAANPASIRTAINYVADMRFLSFLTDSQVADIAAWVSLVVGPPPAPPPNYTGLWYNAPAESESGWGINFTQQGDTLFGTLFTYDADRSPMWLVMSGGQRQGVAVARAAAFGSRVIILDEPTAALGVKESRRVLDLILDVRSRGIPIVLISHNMPHVFEVADRIHIHRLGKRLCVIDPKDHSMSDAVAYMTGAKIPDEAAA